MNISADKSVPVKPPSMEKAEEKRKEPAIPEAPVDNQSAKDAESDIKNKGEKKKTVDDSHKKLDENDDTRELVAEEWEPDEPEKPENREKKESDDKKDENNIGKADAQRLLKELEKQKEESAKIISQQKEILAELKEHQERDKEENVPNEVPQIQQQPGVVKQLPQRPVLQPQQQPVAGVQPQQPVAGVQPQQPVAGAQQQQQQPVVNPQEP